MHKEDGGEVQRASPEAQSESKNLTGKKNEQKTKKREKCTTYKMK